MRVDLDTGKYNVVISSSNFDVSIESGAKLDVNIGKSARIDVNSAVTYIKSGKKEIDTYVEGKVKPDILEYSKVESQKFIDSYVGSTVEEYVEEVTKPSINEYTDTKISEFNKNAVSKSDDFSTLAESLTNEYTSLAQTSEETLIQYVDSASLSAKNAKDSADVSTAQASISTAQAVISTNKASESLASANASANSAKQCQAIKDSLGTVYVFKGSVANVSALPTNAKVGDVYDVQDSGNNYAWTGSSWDSLGVNVDLSNYALKTDLNTKQDKLTAGTGISINNNVISNTQTSAEWGNIQGTLSNQTDLQNALNGKANLNLGNSTAITNCITEIPQDIKLELNNGTLTLKAGSKLYCPNGINTFKEVPINQDFALSFTGVSGQRIVLLFVAYSLTSVTTVVGVNGINVLSGNTVPTVSHTIAYWYDTTNNIIKRTRDAGTTWEEVAGAYLCLPIGLVTTSSGTVTSIDQVFNGFGYIGSTVFALPGVKALAPNGRNTDGTLKNIEFVTNKVQTFTCTSDLSKNGYIYLTLGSNTLNTIRDYSEGYIFPNNPRQWSSFYNVNENTLYRYDGTTWVRINYFMIAGNVYNDANLRITLLTPKLPFRAVDWNDLPQVAGRNIGDIFYTSRTDTELNGAVECNGGTYSTSDFTGSQSIGNLLSGGKVPYVSLSEYASIVSSKGSCRAFGWDGGASFRVPLLKDVYIEAGTASSAGEFISESLPDHTHAFGGSEIPLYASGSGRKADISGGDGGQRTWITATDGANNSTYKDGAKVKPDSVRYRAMVQLAIKSTDEAVITATSALQQLSNKVDKTSATDRATVVGWGMPDYTTSVTWACPSIGSTYTIPYDCELYFSDFNNGGGQLLLTLNNSSGAIIIKMGSSSNAVLVSDRVRLKKGTVLYIANNRQCTVSLITKLYGV